MSLSHTVHPGHFNPSDKISKRALYSVFTRIWNQIKTSQMRRAEHEVLCVLQGTNTKTLQQWGYTCDDIQKLKNGIFTNPSKNTNS